MNQSELVILVAPSVMVSGCTGSAAGATLDSSVAISHAVTSAASQSALTPAAAMPTSIALTPFPITLTASHSPLSTSYVGAAPLALQLAAGTLALDGTDQAVTKDQAVALLPLGKPYAYNARVGNPVSKGRLVVEVVDEIELMMTPTQLKAIADLEITQQSADDVLAQAAPPAEATGSTAAATPAPFASAMIAYLQRVAHAWPRLRVGQLAMRLSDYRSR